MKITQSRAQKHICLSLWSKPEIKSPIFQAEFIVEIASFKSLRKKKKSRKKKIKRIFILEARLFKKLWSATRRTFSFLCRWWWWWWRGRGFLSEKPPASGRINEVV